MADIECRKCGVTAAKCGGYLQRVNEKGGPGIWECRPVCGADLPPETRLELAIEGDTTMAADLFCVCGGSSLCPECNEVEGAKLAAEMRAADARYAVPPCLECGASSEKEAETMCICGGDKDDCHGCALWPDS